MLVVLLGGAYMAIPLIGLAVGALLMVAGRWNAALVAFSSLMIWGPAKARLVRLQLLGFAGRMEEGVALANSMRTTEPEPYARVVLVCTLITAGHCRAALEVGRGVDASSPWWALLEVNLAEADYNLGNWTAALDRLCDVRRKLPTLDVVEDAGDRCQRAWILAHLGRVDDALSELERANQSALPNAFRAEYHFTYVVIMLAAGKLDEALAGIERGRSLARRVSSVRNGQFLEARVRAARGETELALTLFERAANAGYRAQGGDGLLAWGDLLHLMGRVSDATRAWRLAIERDPESESAELAAQRLERGGPGTHSGVTTSDV